MLIFNLLEHHYVNPWRHIIFKTNVSSISGRSINSLPQKKEDIPGVNMCDSGLVLVVILTSFFVMWAFAAVFYSFDYNCNDFTGDNMVKLYFFVYVGLVLFG